MLNVEIVCCSGKCYKICGVIDISPLNFFYRTYHCDIMRIFQDLIFNSALWSRISIHSILHIIYTCILDIVLYSLSIHWILKTLHTIYTVSSHFQILHTIYTWVSYFFQYYTQFTLELLTFFIFTQNTFNFIKFIQHICLWF